MSLSIALSRCTQRMLPGVGWLISLIPVSLRRGVIYLTCSQWIMQHMVRHSILFTSNKLCQLRIIEEIKTLITIVKTKITMTLQKTHFFNKLIIMCGKKRKPFCVCSCFNFLWMYLSKHDAARGVSFTDRAPLSTLWSCSNEIRGGLFKKEENPHCARHIYWAFNEANWSHYCGEFNIILLLFLLVELLFCLSIRIDDSTVSCFSQWAGMKLL